MNTFNNIIVYDHWLARILNIDVYKIHLSTEIFKPSKGNNQLLEMYHLINKLQSKPVFMHTRIATNCIEGINFIENLGFHLIDTNVIFEKSIENLENVSFKSELRFSKLEDKNQVMEIARRSFDCSRFHLDKAFSQDMANKIEVEWVSSYYEGNRGSRMIISLDKDKIIGFLLLLYEGKDILTVDLIAVDKEYRKKGIAKDLIYYTELNHKQYSKLEVGTQIVNIPSVRLYETMGFKLYNSEYIFHYHNYNELRGK